MNVLVTGGLGFIGRTLVDYLMKDPKVNQIDIVDNCCNSKLTQSDWKQYSPRCRFYLTSVKNFTVPEDTIYKQIYHLASPVGPAGVLNYAGFMGPMIINDVVKMAHLANKHGARLLDISTSEVYGKDPGDIPQKENIDKTVPSNITVRLEYGVSKLLSEIVLTNLSYNRKVSEYMEFALVRPFNIVGVGQKGEVGFVLPRFVQQAMRGEPLTVFGDGTQKRTFTSVKDFVEGCMLVMNYAQGNRQIYNIGNPENIASINELAALVIEITGSKSKIQHVDPRTIYGEQYAEAWNKIPDCTKIRQELGWQPTRNLRTIVQEVVDAHIAAERTEQLR
jgi:nucleoside-diphosphate-sugar epimerase